MLSNICWAFFALVIHNTDDKLVSFSSSAFCLFLFIGLLSLQTDVYILETTLETIVNKKQYVRFYMKIPILVPLLWEVPKRKMIRGL